MNKLWKWCLQSKVVFCVVVWHCRWVWRAMGFNVRDINTWNIAVLVTLAFNLSYPMGTAFRCYRVIVDQHLQKPECPVWKTDNEKDSTSCRLKRKSTVKCGNIHFAKSAPDLTPISHIWKSCVGLRERVSFPTLGIKIYPRSFGCTNFSIINGLEQYLLKKWNKSMPSSWIHSIEQENAVQENWNPMK